MSFSWLASPLNPKQEQAVLTTQGPLMVLAGAGSGKTKMLTARMAYLILEQKVAAHEVLAVTFTNKAAGEMRERVAHLLGCPAPRAWGGSAWGFPEIGTFHSVSLKLLRAEAARAGFQKPFVIYDDADQLSLLKTVMEQLGISEKERQPKSLQAAINRAKCDALEEGDLEPELRSVYGAYQTQLMANSAVDFGEIICLAYRLLRDYPEVRAHYQQKYRYLHVDEYQDTNRAQYLLLAQLAQTRFGGKQNICVVGDEDQSIYKWRGADISNILNFEQDYPGAQVVQLEQNYRSTQRILQVAGGVIAHNQRRRPKSLWTENPEGARPIRAQLMDERAEAEMVVAEVQGEMQSAGASLSSLSVRSYQDFAIFYRTHAQSRQFEDVLRREKVPYKIVGGLRFYDRKEIKDILSFFKVILNPLDSVSLKRILNVPARGLGKTTLQKVEQAVVLGDQAGCGSLWGVLERLASEPRVSGSPGVLADCSPAILRKLVSFTKMVQGWSEAQPSLLLSELYYRILEDTQYVMELRQEGTPEAQARVENLEELSTLLLEFEEEQLEGLSESDWAQKRGLLLLNFIEQSSLSSEGEVVDESLPSVKLMTFHSSKGLEFPVVFMVGMEDGLFPSLKGRAATFALPGQGSEEERGEAQEEAREELEEERRLCYVGITRAREQLYLLGVMVRRIWGQTSYQRPSRFFQEIPEELLEFRDFASPRLGDDSSPRYRTGSSRHLTAGLTAGLTAEPGRAGQVFRGSGSAGRGSVGGDVQAVFGGGSDEPTLAVNRDWVGSQLTHPQYGSGQIIAIEGAGLEQKVTIQFRTQGSRKFLLRYVESFVH